MTPMRPASTPLAVDHDAGADAPTRGPPQAPSEAADVDRRARLLRAHAGSPSASAAWSRFARSTSTSPRAAIVSLIGPNGAGKTTFFNIIAGLTEPTEGTITFAGMPVVARARGGPGLSRSSGSPFRRRCSRWRRRPDHRAPRTRSRRRALSSPAIGLLIGSLARGDRPAARGTCICCTRAGIFRSSRPNDIVALGIGRTFQNIRLFANMTALENVHGRHAPRMHASLARRGVPPAERTSREEAAVARGGQQVAALRRAARAATTSVARNLPYGDQRRLEIARALASQPKLLLLDEPTAGMNPVRDARDDGPDRPRPPGARASRSC